MTKSGGSEADFLESEGGGVVSGLAGGGGVGEGDTMVAVLCGGASMSDGCCGDCTSE